MERDAFEAMVEEQFGKVPARIRERLDNVEFVIEEEVAPRRRKAHGLRRGDELLGLYEGVPLPSRGAGYFGVLPDKISIFRGPIERVATRDGADVAALVHETLVHEIGHHFGFCETDVRRLERARKRRDAR